MKTFIHLIFTCFVSVGAFFGAFNAPEPFLLYGVAFSVWILFIWRLNVRMRREARRRYHERMFEDYMRERVRHSRF